MSLFSGMVVVVLVDGRMVLVDGRMVLVDGRMDSAETN